ncbi:hypothetical protein [Pseudocolwellia agarivorans]|uniref:hypothetical protein n=1 Tax=Pseudocolwellia agarivorans TaxID=1911682 RepID=UPI0009843A86|nr:hypothetical protein [Pseudocolwellia agarivorans]
MLISEFIRSYEFERVNHPELGGIIDECLIHLVNFYGYQGDIQTPENWYLDKLDFDEIRLTEEPDRLLFDIDNISLQMANECEFYVLSDPKKHPVFEQKKKNDETKNATLNQWMKLSPKFNEKLEKKKKQEKAHKPKQYYTYKDRTKLTNADGSLVTIDAVKIPLLLAMKDLIQAHLHEQNSISLIIRATKLISASNHLRLLIRLSEQWEDSQNRRIDKGIVNNADKPPINDKEVQYDEKPMNKLRKEIVFDLVKNHVSNNQEQTTDSMVKVIRKQLNDKLDVLNQSDQKTISLSDQDELLNEVKPITLKRWINEAFEVHNSD